MTAPPAYAAQRKRKVNNRQHRRQLLSYSKFIGILSIVVAVIASYFVFAQDSNEGKDNYIKRLEQNITDKQKELEEANETLSLKIDALEILTGKIDKLNKKLNYTIKKREVGADVEKKQRGDIEYLCRYIKKRELDPPTLCDYY